MNMHAEAARCYLNRNKDMCRLEVAHCQTLTELNLNPTKCSLNRYA